MIQASSSTNMHVDPNYIPHDPTHLKGYINGMMQQLEERYEDELALIKQEYKKDPEARQEALVDLTKKYNSMKSQLQDDYNQVGGPISPGLFDKDVQDCERDLNSMANALRSPAQIAIYCTSKASSLSKEFENQILALMSKLGQFEGDLSKDKELLKSLENKLATLKGKSPAYIKKLNEQIASLKKLISGLESQIATLKDDQVKLQAMLVQVEAEKAAINNYSKKVAQAVRNADEPFAPHEPGIQPGQKYIQPLEQALKAIEDLQTGSEFYGIENDFAQASKTSNVISEGLQKLSKKINAKSPIPHFPNHHRESSSVKGRSPLELSKPVAITKRKRALLSKVRA